MGHEVIPFADLSRAATREREALSRAFERVLSRGRFILGEAVAAFESEFAAFAGARFGVGCANGTDAITLALLAAGAGPNDEVITVSMTCAPTATGIVRAGAVPVFVDVAEPSLTMDPAAIEAAITPRTKAILPVHLYGRPADLPAIRAVADAHGLLLVEDCAQAHGASLGGRPVGTIGRVASWSFYPTKNLGALGDGGLVTTDDERVAERLRRLRVYGYETRNDAREMGMNSRLDELQAAFLSERLRLLPEANRRRAEIAARYDELLGKDARIAIPPSIPGAVPCHHLYVVRVGDRDGVRARLQERGIGTDVHYPNAVHQQPAFAGFPRGPLPVTERAVAEILSLPLYPELRDDEVDAVCAALRGALAA